MNVELYTVNAEHQLKLDELTTISNDLSNFLSSTMIGILFVDSNLNIRKFTEYVGREFQLTKHDIGGSIQTFAHCFPDEDIWADAAMVLKDLISIDCEITAMNGRCYTLRIAPYRTTENSISGLVITIIDSLGKDGKKRCLHINFREMHNFPADSRHTLLSNLQGLAFTDARPCLFQKIQRRSPSLSIRNHPGKLHQILPQAQVIVIDIAPAERLVLEPP